MSVKGCLVAQILMDRLIEEDKQRQLAEMKGYFLSWMGGAPAAPKPEDQPAQAK